MELLHKSAHAAFELKAVDKSARTFSGLASTWDLDLDNDVIDPKAFDRTLDHWRASNGRRIIPLVDQHGYDSVRRVFGKLVDARSTSAGLSTKFSIVQSPEGEEYLARIKGGFLNALSIGYQVKKVEDGYVPDPGKTVGGQPQRRKVRVIKDLDLREISAVVWGANPLALIDALSVKRRQQMGWLPDDPERLAAEHRIRTMVLRDLGIAVGGSW